MSTRKLGSRISRTGMALKAGLLGAGLFAVALGCGDRAGTLMVSEARLR